MHITPGELAIVGIGGTLLGALGGGAIAYFAQIRTAKTTLAGQRLLAEDQRIWDRRATVYPEVIDTLREVSFVVLDEAASWSDDSLVKFTRCVDLVASSSRFIHAFASQSVRSTHSDFIDALSDVFDAAQARTNASSDEEAQTTAETLRTVSEGIIPVMSRLRDAMRDDIQGPIISASPATPTSPE